MGDLMASEWALFRRRLLRNPRQVSALAPSSRGLARAMAEGLGPHTGAVVEFGPGTGRLTRGLLQAGVRPQDLTLFELDADFVAHLRATFAGVSVHRIGADLAHETMGTDVGAVISGLPLLSMPPEVRQAIVASAFAMLRPGGVYVQFTYGPRSPVPDDIVKALHLRVEPGRRIWANLPPAQVYRFYRADEANQTDL